MFILEQGNNPDECSSEIYLSKCKFTVYSVYIIKCMIIIFNGIQNISL